MRRVIVKEFEDLAEALSNFSAIFSYRIKNLCVKAEEAALLPVKVMIEGELQNLEKCAIIAKEGDYDFMIFPKYEEDMMQIGQGILAVHPEFKQKIDTMKVDTIDKDGNPKQADAHFIRVTMPEVNDDRYDVLNDGVKVAYEACKAQMQVANTKADVQLAKLTEGETKENIDLIKQERDKLNKQWNEHRDKLYEDKLKEIKDAHMKWLSEVGKEEVAKMEEEEARGVDAAMSMKIGTE